MDTLVVHACVELVLALSEGTMSKIEDASTFVPHTVLLSSVFSTSNHRDS